MTIRATMFFLCTLFASYTLYTKSACIIIHGTWASGESWYQPQGDFFQSVQRVAQELQIVDEVIPFSWSGKLSYHDQYQAAQSLVLIIELYDFVYLIGHSHGATVGIVASQILGQKNQKKYGNIKKFYAIGCPVDLAGEIYPDMYVIEYFYNLFSFGDYIQPANDVYGRCFDFHERIANISVIFEHDTHPTHTQLHHAIIGKELLKIHHYFAEKCLGNFKNFVCAQPAVIQFFEHAVPEYAADNNQKELLALDIKTRWMMNLALFRSHKNDR